MADIGVCDAIIAAVEGAAPQQIQKFPSLGGLMASIDPENQRGLEVITPEKEGGYYSSDTNGGTPKVKLRFYRPDVGGVSSSYSCDALDNEPNTEVVFPLSLASVKSFKFSKQRLQTLCADANSIVPQWLNGVNLPMSLSMLEVRNMVMSKMRAMAIDMNAKIMARYLANFGVNARTGNVTAQNINLWNTATGGIRSDGWAQVETDMAINEFLGAPIVIGGSLGYRFATSLGWSALADTGIDYEKLATQNPLHYYFDNTADTVFGANQMAVLAPGMTKFVQRKKYVGEFAKPHGNSEYGTMTLPELPGVVFDVQLKAIDCDPDYGNLPSWTVIISCDYDLFVMPDIYKTGDPKKGVNGVLRYTGVAV